MKMLAFEFSSDRRSVAALRDGEVVACARELAPRSRGPLALVEDALAHGALDRTEVDTLAVGLGPGSYNGVRVAIALAQGWQLARSVPLRGVGSWEVLAHQAFAGGHRGPLAVVIDAHRAEFYVARFELGASGPALVEPLRLADLNALRQLDAEGIQLCGPDLLEGFPRHLHLYPDAALVAQLALPQPDSANGSRLEPIYLRETRFVKAPPARPIPPLPPNL